MHPNRYTQGLTELDDVTCNDVSSLEEATCLNSTRANTLLERLLRWEELKDVRFVYDKKALSKLA
jgi:hypothetical protein